MKRFFILSIVLLSIYCTQKSCSEETDQSKCQSHSMESKFNYLSCFKYEKKNKLPCFSFFINEKPQKEFNQLQKGFQKEKISGYGLSEIEEDDTIVVFEKDKYNTDETIKAIEVNTLRSLTEEDKRIINNKNTCFYRSYANFGEVVSDKNICFNVDKFADSKDVLDCGFTTIKGK